ncbi:hypothetical protein ACJJIF_10735 [Microbulbifer sp. SSSA002]|uniref:hypothetical protein n=1 Tax=Microbulbifer sp. SSSA002 TaxID=3243376 RepID=UPI00403A3E25
MAKSKNRLTAEQKREKANRKKRYNWIFINGKQVRVKRPPVIDGMDVNEYIERNADEIWLHQEGMWEVLHGRKNDEDYEDIF